MERPTDPIIAELRAIREAYAARFNYDVDAMFKDLRAKQAASGREYVRLPSRVGRAGCSSGAARGGLARRRCAQLETGNRLREMSSAPNTEAIVQNGRE